MTQLRATGLTEPLRETIASGCPYLGICLGMQFLYETSEESPGIPGLALLTGQVRRFTTSPEPPSASYGMEPTPSNTLFPATVRCS